MPGAASNVGGEYLRTRFRDRDDLSAMDRAAVARFPSGIYLYALPRRGERFPFVDPEVKGFAEPSPRGRVDQYAAALEGIAYVERWCYEILEEFTGCSGGEVYSTGAGSTSDIWVQCRANITGRVIHRPAKPSSAFGSAVLAASTLQGSIQEAAAQMVQILKTFEPDPELLRTYEPRYQKFREICRNRDYS